VGWLGDRLVYSNPFSGKRETIEEVSTFAYATPRRAADELAAPLRQAGLSVRLVGDCLAPRTLLAAIHEGAQVVNLL